MVQNHHHLETPGQIAPSIIHPLLIDGLIFLDVLRGVRCHQGEVVRGAENTTLAHLGTVPARVQGACTHTALVCPTGLSRIGVEFLGLRVSVVGV